MDNTNKEEMNRFIDQIGINFKLSKSSFVYNFSKIPLLSFLFMNFQTNSFYLLNLNNHSAELDPPSPPTLKVEPSNPQIAGQYKRFTCTAKDGNPLAKLKFYKQREGKFNRVPIQSTALSSSTTNQNSISTLDLLLTPNENGATIICEIDQHPALSSPSFVSKQIEVYFINEQLNLTTESAFKSNRQPNNNDEWKLNDEFNLVCKAGKHDALNENTYM